MTENALEGLEPEQEIEVEAPEPVEEPEGPSKSEVEARKYGWKPKEEYDRDPEGWVDADRFLDLPSTHKKQLRDELRAEREAREAEKAEFAQRMERLERANKDAMDRALAVQKQTFERQIQEIRAKKRDAVDMADSKAYEHWDKQEQTLMQRAPEQPRQEPQEQPGARELQEYMASDDGKWLSNPLLAQEAAMIVGQSPVAMSMKPQEQFQWVRQRMAERYPQMFPKAPEPQQQAQPAQRFSKVDGGGQSSGKRSRFSEMPPEAQAAARMFKEESGLPIEAYVESYWAENGQ